MIRFHSLLSALFLLATTFTPAFADDEATSAGRKIFENRCASCHQNTPSSTTLGPSLVGIIGKKAGTENSGVHSRAVVESGIVWDRNSLRRYLSDPGRDIPGTVMPVRVEDPKELGELLDYLETLR